MIENKTSKVANVWSQIKMSIFHPLEVVGVVT